MKGRDQELIINTKAQLIFEVSWQVQSGKEKTIKIMSSGPKF
jgi:hypothetical protein